MALLLRAAADGTLVAMADLRGAVSPADAIAEATSGGAVELWAYGEGWPSTGSSRPRATRGSARRSCRPVSRSTRRRT